MPRVGAVIARTAELEGKKGQTLCNYSLLTVGKSSSPLQITHITSAVVTLVIQYESLLFFCSVGAVRFGLVRRVAGKGDRTAAQPPAHDDQRTLLLAVFKSTNGIQL